MENPSISLTKADDGSSPMSLAKLSDAEYQQQQQQYDQQQQMIIQQQQMIIQQQQQQLYSQQRNNEELQLAQQKLEQQQIQLQQLQYERAQLQSNHLAQQYDQDQLLNIQNTAALQQTNPDLPNPIAVIDPESEPAYIEDGRLKPPGGTQFVGENRGTVKIRVIRGTNLVSADINGYSDPFVKIKSSCFNHYPQTRVVDKSLNPVWEETFYLQLESIQTELLMFRLYDHDKLTHNDSLGYFGINLSLLPLGMEVTTVERLFMAKHGTVEVAITAVDFGLTKIPPNYIETYQQWRSGLKVMERAEFKLAKTSSLPLGPYYGKIAHPDFKIVHGYPKLRKTSRAKFADGLAAAGLATLAVLAVIFTSSGNSSYRTGYHHHHHSGFNSGFGHHHHSGFSSGFGGGHHGGGHHGGGHHHR